MRKSLIVAAAISATAAGMLLLFHSALPAKDADNAAAKGAGSRASTRAFSSATVLTRGNIRTFWGAASVTNGAGAVLHFDHLEVVLARAALRTGPVHRHVLPARAGRDAFAGNSRRFVVNPSADEAHPGLVLHLLLGHGWRDSKICTGY